MVGSETSDGMRPPSLPKCEVEEQACAPKSRRKGAQAYCLMSFSSASIDNATRESQNRIEKGKRPDELRLTLRTLQWQPKRTVPHVLCQRTQGTRYAEDDGVVLELANAVVVEHTARGGVDIRERVLRLAVLLEHVWRNLGGLYYEYR